MVDHVAIDISEESGTQSSPVKCLYEIANPGIRHTLRHPAPSRLVSPQGTVLRRCDAQTSHGALKTRIGSREGVEKEVRENRCRDVLNKYLLDNGKLLVKIAY